MNDLLQWDTAFLQAAVDLTSVLFRHSYNYEYNDHLISLLSHLITNKCGKCNEHEAKKHTHTHRNAHFMFITISEHSFQTTKNNKLTLDLTLH